MDPTTGRPVGAPFTGDTSRVLAVVFSPDGGGWALGHANGMNDGYIPNDGRLYNC